MSTERAPVLLSIVIPSHNRVDLLRDAVTSIVADPAFDGRVELCVSDNSPSGQAESMLAALALPADRCRYRRSLDAPSLDENVRTAAAMAQGAYVWFFGDDDLLIPGALGPLLDMLDGRPAPLVVVNSRSFTDTTVIEPLRVPVALNMSYRVDEDDRFLVDLGGYLTYLGAIVVERSAWESHYAADASGTLFAHLATVMRIKRGRVAWFFARPAIAMRVHSQTWTAAHFRVWNVGYPSVVWGLDGYGDPAKAAVIPRQPLHAASRLAASRAYGRYDARVYRDVIAGAGLSLFRRSIAWGIARVPQPLMRQLYVWYVQVVRRRHRASFSPALALAQLRASEPGS
jgi:glycosyltransferase involved in cell wall biosynthesis